MLVICIMILVYLIMGKDVKHLVEKLKNVDWNGKVNEIKDTLKPYALRAGRTAARPLLQFYYVMKSPETTTMEKALIYAAIIYTVSPIDLIPSSVYKFLGILDDGAAILYVYKKIQSKITPAIKLKVEETLDEWFGEIVTI